MIRKCPVCKKEFNAKRIWHRYDREECSEIGKCERRIKKLSEAIGLKQREIDSIRNEQIDLQKASRVSITSLERNKEEWIDPI
jgi:hypothetical protein